ncbi:hypothetical protein DL771_005408 [Monosporascus sp. 5C6A]|nr:hypothetical protein DL771_005408 [Monosporascus sp. 5C6A]
MLLSTLFLSSAGFIGSALGYHEGDKIYAQTSDIDLGHGTAIFEGVKYAFEAPPGGEHWYITNSNGTETPHWKYLPNMKASASASFSAASVPADSITSEAGASLDKRQQPPAYMNYYNDANCRDFDAQNRPVTQNRCVYNRGYIAWSSSFTPAPFTCRYIVNYYNSGCGPGSTCSGYITQTFDWAGCFAPPRIFCSTYARCCLSGC